MHDRPDSPSREDLMANLCGPEYQKAVEERLALSHWLAADAALLG